MQLCLAPCVPGAASAHVGAEWCSASLSLALVGAENYVTSCDLRIFVDQPHRGGGAAKRPTTGSRTSAMRPDAHRRATPPAPVLDEYAADDVLDRVAGEVAFLPHVIHASSSAAERNRAKRWSAARALPWPNGSRRHPSPSRAATTDSSAANTAAWASRTPSPPPCARSSPTDGLIGGDPGGVRG